MAPQLLANTRPAPETQADALVVGLFADGSLTPSAKAVDAASGGRLQALVARGDLIGKTGRSLLLLDLPGISAQRVLVVGLGDAGKLSVAALRKATSDALRALADTPVDSVLLTFSELDLPQGQSARHVATAAVFACYRYTATRKGNGERLPSTIHLQGGDVAAIAAGKAIGEATNLTRELGHLPPNICNPAFLAKTAQDIASEHDGVTVEVLERDQMAALGMGALLAVARGSANAPKLIVLHWRGGGEAKPYVLVGKGITFDTGGVNLKTLGGIEEMKFDMLGAGAVLGTFAAVAKLRLPINVVAIVAAVENMCDGDSYRPSDVLTSMSGKTIEVGNTDAEGRLILCDALTYAQRFQPAALVDVATLTGACVIALGKHATGLMSHDDGLAEELLSAGTRAHDRAWRLPLWDDYQAQLDSIYADVYNIGGKPAGAITAGCFLSRFAEGQRWAHLDIAGSGWDEGRKGMATGRPVGLLVQWLIDRAG